MGVVHRVAVASHTTGWLCSIIGNAVEWTGKCFDESGPGEGERLGCAASLEML